MSNGSRSASFLRRLYRSLCAANSISPWEFTTLAAASWKPALIPKKCRISMFDVFNYVTSLLWCVFSPLFNFFQSAITPCAVSQGPVYLTATTAWSQDFFCRRGFDLFHHGVRSTSTESLWTTVSRMMGASPAGVVVHSDRYNRVWLLTASSSSYRCSRRMMRLIYR
jgi:hypothetical protein